MTLEQKRAAIEPGHRRLSVRRQCELLDLPRSSLYYQARAEDHYNEELMRLLDRQYTQTPFYGVPRMTQWLRRQGHPVNHKRVRRLLRQMGLEAIYPRQKRNLSQPDSEHKIFPYLLKNRLISRPDQVWAADITYVSMYRGWLYLTAIMDWYSRYVLAWEISITLQADFCIAALERALGQGRPEIFNTDQGSQFTCASFRKSLQETGVQISMDGRGRAFDNIFIERLWRSVKTEEIYLHDYQTVGEARLGLQRYFEFYNQERLHQGLSWQTPAEVYLGAACSAVALRAPSEQAAETGAANPSYFPPILV